MHRTAALLAFSAVLTLSAGCRDVLVDPPPVPGPAGPPAPPAVENAILLYLKGPATLALGGEGNYRAQAAPGAVEYRWQTLGDGRLELVIGGDSRLPQGYARGRGPVEVYVSAIDADGRVVGRGSRVITIR